MFMEASVDPQPWGPDWMPITPKRGPYSMPIHNIDAIVEAALEVAKEARRFADLMRQQSLNTRGHLSVIGHA